jgi:tetratricopeptide (TPR) repeat protein
VTPRPQDRSPALHAAALDRARRGEHDAAIAAIAAALVEDGGEAARAEAAGPLAAIAGLAERAGDLAAAERAITAALAQRPDFPDLHLRHARLLSRLDRRREARAAIERALARAPRFAEARLEHAMLDAREGRVGEALASLHALTRDCPVHEPRAFEQGVRKLEQANWDAADSLLRRALQVEDAELETALTEARADLAADRAGEAAARMRAQIARHPAYPDLHALLGAAELQRGHVDDAVAALARALELHPDFLEARALFAGALESMGLFAAAAEQASFVLERDPAHAGARAIESRWSGHRRRSRRLTAS